MIGLSVWRLIDILSKRSLKLELLVFLFVKSEDQLVDILTKAVASKVFLDYAPT